MKKKKNELDVDFIGGQEPLTKDEEKAISNYIRSQKAKRERIQSKPKSRVTKSRTIANT